MATYLKPELLSGAVSRLASSRAQRGFIDFLILKRALRLAGSATVPFSMKDEHFIVEVAGEDGKVLPLPRAIIEEWADFIEDNSVSPEISGRELRNSG